MLFLLIAAPLAAQTADLSVTVTAPASVVADGFLFNFAEIRITVTNNGPGTASDVVLTHQLNIPMTFSARLRRGVGGPFCAPESDPGVCTIGTLASGESVIIASDQMIGVVTEPAPMTATESVTSSTPETNSANDTATITTQLLQPAIDLYFISGTADKTTVLAGGLVTYTFETLYGFSYRNIPQSVMTIVLPPGATLVSAGGPCSGTTTIVCNVPPLFVEMQAKYTVTVHAPLTPGPTTATATLSSPYLADPNPANNTVSVAVAVEANPAVPALSGTALAVLGMALAAVGLLRR